MLLLVRYKQILFQDIVYGCGIWRCGYMYLMIVFKRRFGITISESDGINFNIGEGKAKGEIGLRCK